uniref:RxLR effector protein n=1 Tax=Phytophthora sojae TaxID=67593 RepID=G1FRE7_PHYSO|nr:Avh111 [Phytophthora sojae]AEK80686.1 Avh111 [Phytophthora sojae]
MRAHFILFAAAVAILASSDAASTTEASKVASPGVLSATGLAVHMSGIGKRFLRIREAKDNDDLEGEDRGLVTLVYEGGRNFFKKMTQSAPSVNKVDDQLALVKSEDKWLVGQVDKYTDKYLEMFKQIHAQGYTPRQVSRMSGLAKRTLTMNKNQLLHDGDYMFWLYYSRWWAKNVAKKAAKLG